MDQPSPKPKDSSLYERDFYAWTRRQAEAIEHGRFDEIDGANLAEEVRALGARLQEEVRERVEILLSHLLKWRHLAEYRGKAWKENIDRQREELAELSRSSPSLDEFIRDAVVEGYGHARERLQYDTYYFPADFPAALPFTVDQVLTPDFYPEELDGSATGRLPSARSMA